MNSDKHERQLPTENPRCFVCGKPATQSAVDMLRRANNATGYLENEPIGGVKYGCDEHPVTSETRVTRIQK